MPNSLLGSPYGGLGFQILAAPALINDIIGALPHLELYYWLDDPPTNTTAIDASGNNRDGTIHGTPTFNAAYAASAAAMQFNATTDYLTSVGTPINITEGTIAFFYRGVDGTVPPASGTTAILFGLSDGTLQDKVFWINDAGSIGFKVWDTTTSEWVGVYTPAGTQKLDRWMLLTGTFIGGTVSLTVNTVGDPYYFHGTASYGGTTVSTFATANVHVAGGWPGPDTYAGWPGYYDELYVQKYVSTDPPALPPVWGSGALAISTSPVFVTDMVADVLRTGVATPDARASQIVMEVIRNSLGINEARVTQFTMEVLRTAAVGVNYPAGDTLVFTDAATYVRIRPVVHTVSIAQSLAFTQSAYRIKAASVNQTLAFTETTVAYNDREAGDTLTFTETAVLTAIRNRHVLQTLAFTEANAEGHDANLGVGQILVFDDAARIGHVRTTTVLQFYSFTDTAAAHHLYTESDGDTLAFTDTATYALVTPIRVHVTDTLVFTQSGSPFVPDHGSGNDTLEFTQAATIKQTHVRHVTDTLYFLDNLVQNPGVHVRSVTQTLAFYEGTYPVQYPITIGGKPVVVAVPVATILAVTPTVLLKSATGVIVLPSPEFDDSEATYDKVNIRRTMVGGYFSYVQTSNVTTLKYSFILGRQKARELRAFMVANLSTLITLTNWKAQVYVGQFTTNPFSLSTDSRYASAYEKVSVGFEFEGVKT